MRAREFINESFDSNVPIEIVSQTRINFRTTANIGGRQIVFNADWFAPARSWELKFAEIVMLIRDPNKKDLHKGLSKSFCGHTPVKSHKQIGSHVFIDTGCGYPNRTGKLTIARAADLVFFEG